ncbi:MAG: iron-sulfur cluster repair di-iron protein [Bacteroidia bacterium]|nr:iron-sulfur cluster repair di-iron protein [Bacteroidia bacterium]
MKTLEIINVTLIEPRLKHPTIFEKFDSLLPGEGFVIHNDHDPKPLYYQLLGERGNIFKWNYIESGPEWWKVSISKLNQDEKEPTIGELVKKDFRKAEVFKKYGLDFCCGGKKTLTAACKEKGLDVVQIEQELKSCDVQHVVSSNNYDSWDLAFLADYIVNQHHKYVKLAIPVLFEYTQKVARVHGDRNPEVVSVAEKFILIADELNRHMCKEEDVLFPYIKHLSEAKSSGMKVEASPFGTVENPINMMEHEHDIVGRMMEEVRSITNGYNPPANACTTFRLSYQKLEEFENDLHQHIHLENNILFPKAIDMEKELQ